MRPQQQNRRMRGRNNNRKGPNPLTRNYESNGPDVKIRGSAQQVADKYAALARDAQSAGDRVMAENYLQHAEHYNRVIAAASAQAQAQRESRENREEREGRDDSADEDAGERKAAARESSPAREPANDGTGPQPVIEGTPAEVALGARQPQPEKRRGRGRKPGDGGEAPSADGGSEPAESAGKGDTPAKRATRRPRRPVVSGESADDGNAPKNESSSDSSLTAAAGE